MERQRICILAWKDVRRTIHVLKQIDYLSRQYDLTVIGWGEPDPAWRVDWRPIRRPGLPSKVARLFWSLLGLVVPICYLFWYWSASAHRQALREAVASGADAFHANDLITLPVAVEAARRTGGRVVFHMHEYSVLEREDSPIWRWLVAPAFRYLLRRYTTRPEAPIDASITVCQPIADRYRREWGLDPIVVYNVPKPLAAPPAGAPAAPERVRMIHHGYAKRGRGLHNLVRAVALADQRFRLDFMLVEDNPGYVDELKALAARLAPGRVSFVAPVQPHEIVARVSEYAIGLCVIEPTTYNNLMMLPNKFFEYVQAGLALCVGPSPAMVDLVERDRIGVSAPSFEPAAVAATLNALTLDEIERMRAAARAAAGRLNADVEMARIVALYERVLAPAPRAVADPAAASWRGLASASRSISST